MISCYHGGAAGLLSGECEASGEQLTSRSNWLRVKTSELPPSQLVLTITCHHLPAWHHHPHQHSIDSCTDIEFFFNVNIFDTFISSNGIVVVMLWKQLKFWYWHNFFGEQITKVTPVIAYHTLKDSISSVSIRFQKSSLSKRRVTAFIHCKLSSWK